MYIVTELTNDDYNITLNMMCKISTTTKIQKTYILDF